MNGRVIDATTNEPAPFAVVFADRAGQRAGIQSDINGKWSYSFVPGDVVNVALTGYYLGQYTYDQLLATAALGGTPDVIARITPDPTMLQEATVTATRKRFPWGLLLLLVPLLLDKGKRK